MKLLFLNHNVARSGGTYFRALAVGRELAGHGHSVTLLTISPTRRWGSERAVVDGVHVIETPDLLFGPGRTGWDPFDALWRIGHLRREGWDLIHGWDSRPVVILPALAARSRSGAPLVIDWADWWGRGGTQAEREGGLAKRLYAPIETYFEEAFRTRADGTTVISEALAGRARALGVAAGTIHRLPQGCDPSAAMVTDRAAARARLGVPLSEPMFVSVGRLLPADGQLLFEAMDYVLRERPDARLVLIGRHGAKIPGALVRSGRVVESGFVTDELLRQNMSACDALVVALADTIASWARWPSKVNPFLASGRAVVVTRVGDLPALLEREGAAFVAAPEPRALAEATIAAASERDRRSNHEQRALELARGRLAWPVIIDDLLAFYRRVPQGPAVCPTVSESSNA